jgi:hypothetical protein
MTSCDCGDGGGSTIGLHNKEYIYFLADFFLVDTRFFGVIARMIAFISLFIALISLFICFMNGEFMVFGGDIYNNEIKK